MMMMKCQFHWWREPEHRDETTDLRQVTDRLLHIYSGLCPVLGWNSGRRGVKVGDVCYSVYDHSVLLR